MEPTVCGLICKFYEYDTRFTTANKFKLCKLLPGTSGIIYIIYVSLS